MIRNDAELAETKQLRTKFKASLKAHRASHGKSKPGEMAYLTEQGLIGQIDDLDFQIKTYTALKDGTSVQLRRFADIGMVLIAARIIKKLTQAELAKKLDMKQQQIQRYEASDYHNISIERMDRVVEALDVGFHL